MEITYPAHMTAVTQLNTVYGSARPRAVVRLLLDENEIATTTADGRGKWSFEFRGGYKTAGGTHIITAVGGNETAKSKVFIRSRLPAPKVTEPKNKTEIPNGEITVFGSASPNIDVVLRLSSNGAVFVRADENGFFKHTFSGLKKGAHRLFCMQQMPSRNLYSPYTETEFTVTDRNEKNAVRLWETPKTDVDLTVKPANVKAQDISVKTELDDTENTDEKAAEPATSKVVTEPAERIRKRKNTVVLQGYFRYRTYANPRYKIKGKTLEIGKIRRKLNKNVKNDLNVKIDVLRPYFKFKR